MERRGMFGAAAAFVAGWFGGGTKAEAGPVARPLTRPRTMWESASVAGVGPDEATCHVMEFDLADPEGSFVLGVRDDGVLVLLPKPEPEPEKVEPLMCSPGEISDFTVNLPDDAGSRDRPKVADSDAEVVATARVDSEGRITSWE